MIEIRRPDDDELCGFVPSETGGEALAVSAACSTTAGSADTLNAWCATSGLAALAERWLLVDGPGADEQIVCIQEASPEGVTLALDYYSMPGVPTLRAPRTPRQR
ncbi:MAG: hypothetical protein R2713_05340 [Ilumatobacteraceae bacterium]